MKNIMKNRFFLVLALALVAFLAPSCKKEKQPTPTATINVMAGSFNKSGDIGGNGGTATKTFTFNNTNTTAGWDMSITASVGTFQLILKDASGTVVLDKILTAGSGAQSASGTSIAGTVGQWSATINLSNFNGRGDYSFL